MDNWKEGDIAICLKDDNFFNMKGNTPPIREGLKYYVNNVHVCKCGRIALDLGLRSRNDKVNTSCSCLEQISGAVEIHWCSAKRFKRESSLEERVKSYLIKNNIIT